MPTLRQKLVSSLTRRYPLYSGCGDLANKPMLHKLAGISDETAWARTKWGEVLAPLGDYVGRAAYFMGDLDPKITWICSRLIRPGDTVMDIGANIGLVTVCMAKLTGKTGRVHSFEPNPKMVDLLRQVIARNKFANVTLHPIALSDAPSTLKLSIRKDNYGQASLASHDGDDHNYDVVQVVVERLSDVADQQQIKTIRLLKIDVEGFEAQVIRGAHPLFKTTCPQAIIFESNGLPKLPPSEDAVFRELMAYDYQFFAIERSPLRVRLRAFDVFTAPAMPEHDFLAVLRGPHYEDIVRRLHIA